MYNVNQRSSCPCYENSHKYYPYNMCKECNRNPCPYYDNKPMYNFYRSNYRDEAFNPYMEFDRDGYYDPQNEYPITLPYEPYIDLMDYGPEPFVINIKEATEQNDTFRTAIWTGNHLQLTLMSLDVGEDIGFEVHPDTVQFIRIEEGQGLVLMGDTRDNMDFQERVYEDFIFIIPAGKWHNLINTGRTPLKVYSIYAPPKHPHGTVHETKEDAMEAEMHNHH